MNRAAILLGALLLAPMLARAATETPEAEMQAGLAALQRGDYREGVADIRQSAEQGFKVAEAVLAFMYDRGRFVPQSYAKAFKWYRLLARQGDAVSESMLGVMYADGAGVPQDYGKALKWYRLAAAQGNAKAEFGLGLMYEQGDGVVQDYASALKWYRLAVQQGNAEAEHNLATMYAKGEGVVQDYTEAYKWSLITKATMPSTDRRYANLSKSVKLLAAVMTPAQIRQAQQEATAWYAAHQHATR